MVNAQGRIRGAVFDVARAEVLAALEREQVVDQYSHYKEQLKLEQEEKARNTLDKARSSNALPVSSGGGAPILPLKVVLAESLHKSGDEVLLLRVSLLAAGTQLEWTVERSWKDFQKLYSALRRYKHDVHSLPGKLITTDRKRLQHW
jgi:hypothetical protein